VTTILQVGFQSLICTPALGQSVLQNGSKTRICNLMRGRRESRVCSLFAFSCSILFLNLEYALLGLMLCHSSRLSADNSYRSTVMPFIAHETDDNSIRTDFKSGSTSLSYINILLLPVTVYSTQFDSTCIRSSDEAAPVVSSAFQLLTRSPSTNLLKQSLLEARTKFLAYQRWHV